MRKVMEYILNYILTFMKMDRKSLKGLSRMGKKMDSLLGGMEMERKSMKELTRMGKKFLLRSGTKMVRLRND